MKKYFVLFFLTMMLVNSPANAAKSKLPKACKEGIKACVSLEQGTQTTAEALQACIHCCSEDIKRISSEACFNSCTNKCSIKFTGKPIKRTNL